MIYRWFAIALFLIFVSGCVESRKVVREDPLGTINSVTVVMTGSGTIHTKTTIDTTKASVTVYGAVSYYKGANAWLVTMSDGREYLNIDGKKVMYRLAD